MPTIITDQPFYPLRQSFCAAARSDKIFLVQQILELERKSNQSLIGWSLSKCLEYSVKHRSLKVADLLLEAGADPIIFQHNEVFNDAVTRNDAVVCEWLLNVSMSEKIPLFDAIDIKEALKNSTGSEINNLLKDTLFELCSLEN